MWLQAVAAGIDAGARNLKVVLLQDGRVVGRSCLPIGFSVPGTADDALRAALDQAGLDRGSVRWIGVTGTGRRSLGIGVQLTEVGAAARAAALMPAARTLIEVGAEEARAIRLDGKGNAVDFALNARCAAGAGSFVETMSRALEMDVARFAEISLESTRSIPMSAQCAVFAESEVVGLIHANTSPADIARAVHESMAVRVATLAKRTGIEPEVVLCGGVAHNRGFVQALSAALGVERLHRLPHPEYVGAHGVALHAASAGSGSGNSSGLAVF